MYFRKIFISCHQKSRQVPPLPVCRMSEISNLQVKMVDRIRVTLKETRAVLGRRYLLSISSFRFSYQPKEYWDLTNIVRNGN